MVLSKRSLIHSDSFQLKIYSYLKLFLVGSKLKAKTNEIDLFQRTKLLHFVLLSE